MSTPYFYVLQHKNSRKLYAGVRFKSGCHPKELLTPKGYNTSSKVVEGIMSREGIDSFRILYVVTQTELGCDVRDFEYDFLTLHDACNSDIWLNRSNGRGLFPKNKGSSVILIIHDLHTSEFFKGTPSELGGMLGLVNLAKYARQRMVHSKRYEVFYENESLEEYRLARSNMRAQGKIRQSAALEEGRIRSEQVVRSNAIKRRGMYDLYDIESGKLILTGTVNDMRLFGIHNAYKIAREDYVSSNAKYAMIENGKDFASELERKRKVNTERLKEGIAKMKAKKNGAAYEPRLS